jgi:hypothetical protein
MRIAFLSVVGAALLVSACSPQIVVKYDVPAKLHFGGVQNVYVDHTLGSPDLLTVLDPVSALMRSSVAPDVARRLEQQLANLQLFGVFPLCQAPCPAADTLVQVEMDSSQVNHGIPATGSSSGEETWGKASVKIRVLNRDGTSRYEGTYSGKSSAGVPKVGAALPNDVDLVRQAAFNATDVFIGELMPTTGRVYFSLEDEGVLEPGVKLAMEGDLDGAWNAFREVLMKDPNNAAALYDLGVVMTAKGELEQARDAFAAAARLDPQYQDDAEGAAQRLANRDAWRAQQTP